MQLDVQAQGWVFPGSTSYDDGRGTIAVELLTQYITPGDADTLQRLEHDLLVYEDLVIKDAGVTLVADTDYIVGPINVEVSNFIAVSRGVPTADIQVVTGIYIQDTGHLGNQLTVTGTFAGDEMSMRDFNNLPLAGAIDSYDYFNEYTKNQVVAFASQIYISKEPNNLGNPPKVNRVVTGAYQAYTNLVTDPCDLRAAGANWTASNTTDNLTDIEINGNKFTKIINSGVNSGYNKQTFTSAFLNNQPIFSCTAKKGNTTGNTGRILIYNDTFGAQIGFLTFDWDNFGSSPGIPAKGTLLDYNWIDAETLQFYLQVDALNDLDDDIFIGLYASPTATADEYTYWSEVQLIDSSSITMYPFVDGTHPADVINETFTMPDKFIVRLKIDPKFSYDVTTDKYFLSYYIDASHYLYIIYSQAHDLIRFLWRDGGTLTALNSQKFGSGFTELNQKLDIIIFLDLKGGINDSMFIIIPQESGVINTDNAFDSSPDIKSSDFPTASIAWNGNVGQQADSNLELLQFIDWDGIKPTITSSADVDTYLAGMVPLFETNDEDPKDWWSSWPLNVAIENTKRPAIDNTIIPKFIGEAYTNLVKDPCDLRASGSNWTANNSTNDLTDIEINGNKFTKIINSGDNTGYIKQTITATFTNLVLTGKVTIKKGSSSGNTTRLQLFDATAPATLFNIIIDWDNYGSSPATPSVGTLLGYNWTDAETLEIYFKGIAIASLTNDVFVACYGSNNATDGEYTYWSEVQLIDSSSITMFPFINGTHAADVVDVEQTMSDVFAFDMIIDPKFAYDVISHRFFLTWYLASTERLQLFYDFSSNKIEIYWIDGGSGRYLYSGEFNDDGSGGLTKLNQRLRLTVFLNLTTVDTDKCKLVITPLELGDIFSGSTWSSAPNIKSTNFSTLYIGQTNAGANQADSDIEYLRLYKWDGVDVGTIQSNEQLEEIMQSMDMIFEAIPDAFIPKTISIETPVSSALQQVSNHLASGLGIKDGAILPRHMNNAQEGLPDGLAELRFETSSTSIFPDWVARRVSDDILECMVNWPETPKQGTNIVITLPTTLDVVDGTGLAKTISGSHTTSNLTIKGKHVGFRITEVGVFVTLNQSILGFRIAGSGCKLTIE